MKKQTIFMMSMLLAIQCSTAQSHQVELLFTPVFQNEKLVIDKPYYITATNDSVRIEKLAFYISDILLTCDNKEMYHDSSSHLVVVDDEHQSQPISVNVSDISFNHIQFSLGVDSLMNTSGAHGGDLDPTKDMYWTWQSGYINFKIEGTSPQCKERHQRFQFHIGGYESANNALQSLQFALKPSAKIDIGIDLGLFFERIILESTPNIMSPGASAVAMARQFSSTFFIR